MTSIKQMALLTVLAGGASSIWVPGLRQHLPDFITGGTQASSSPHLEVIEDMEVFPDGIEEGPGGPASLREKATGSEAGESASSGELLHALRNFKAYRLDKSSTTAVSVPKAEVVAEDPVSKTLVADWVSDHPLQGVLLSPKGHRAFFGTLSYAEGQETAPGLLIQEIRRNGVLLSLEGESLWVELPPLGAPAHARPNQASPTDLPPVDSSDIETEIE